MLLFKPVTDRMPEVSKTSTLLFYSLHRHVQCCRHEPPIQQFEMALLPGQTNPKVTLTWKWNTAAADTYVQSMTDLRGGSQLHSQEILAQHTYTIPYIYHYENPLSLLQISSYIIHSAPVMVSLQQLRCFECAANTKEPGCLQSFCFSYSLNTFLSWLKSKCKVLHEGLAVFVTFS